MKQKAKIRALLAVKVAVTLGVGVYLYSKVKSGTFNIDYSLTHPIYFVLACLLTPINWLVESAKWKLLAAQVEEISLWVAVKATLSGLASSVITPFRLGDPVGKVLFLQEGNRMQGSFLSVTGSLLQLAATMLFGVIGIIYISAFTINKALVDYYVYGAVVIAAAVILGVVAFYIIKKKYAATLQATLSIGWAKLSRAFALSVFRYMLFIAQFVLVFMAYGEFNIVQVAVLVPVYFFVAAFVPMFIATEGPTRGAIALAVFGTLYNPFSVATMVWIINLLIPAGVGLVFIWQNKNKTKIVKPLIATTKN